MIKRAIINADGEISFTYLLKKLHHFDPGCLFEAKCLWFLLLIECCTNLYILVPIHHLLFELFVGEYHIGSNFGTSIYLDMNLTTLSLACLLAWWIDRSAMQYCSQFFTWDISTLLTRQSCLLPYGSVRKWKKVLLTHPPTYQLYWIVLCGVAWYQQWI